MAEYTANALQTVAAGQNFLFTNAPDPCTKGLIIHRDGSGIFTLKGIVPTNYSSCQCNKNEVARYLVNFGTNVQIPTGGTVGPITLALAIDGEVLPDSTVIVTPATAEEFQNVSRTISVPIPRGCCENIALENIGTGAIEAQNTTITFMRPDLFITR